MIPRWRDTPTKLPSFANPIARRSGRQEPHCARELGCVAKAERDGPSGNASQSVWLHPDDCGIAHSGMDDGTYVTVRVPPHSAPAGKFTAKVSWAYSTQSAHEGVPEGYSATTWYATTRPTSSRANLGALPSHVRTSAVSAGRGELSSIRTAMMSCAATRRSRTRARSISPGVVRANGVFGRAAGMTVSPELVRESGTSGGDSDEPHAESDASAPTTKVAARWCDARNKPKKLCECGGDCEAVVHASHSERTSGSRALGETMRRSLCATPCAGMGATIAADG